MPDIPAARADDPASTVYDAGHPTDRTPATTPAEPDTTEPLPVVGEDPEVGLAQKGTGEEAIVRRETEI